LLPLSSLAGKAKLQPAMSAQELERNTLGEGGVKS
jgi:hypothetical protein